MPTISERIEGGLLGLLIGDALGVPYEFHEPQDLPSLDEIEFIPPLRSTARGQGAAFAGPDGASAGRAPPSSHPGRRIPS